jgi:hypothetical protein
MSDLKPFQVRLPRDSWLFLRRKSIDIDASMNDIIIQLVRKYKEKCENKSSKGLTDSDTMIS